MTRAVSAAAQIRRDPALRDTDIAAARAIAQAAVDVELFTIPLYMTSLYSIQGMHALTSKGGTTYKGRLWPGATTTAKPVTANEKAFNILFSVFIQEMLHLQMAANIAASVGVKPVFTSTALQGPTHGWICYGPKKSVIPHIIDLDDTINEQVAVDIGPLDAPRVELFLAIEQPEAAAMAAIKPDKRNNYRVSAPFANWTPAQPLPMFGTIGTMYQCYWDYLNLGYTDGTTLWQTVFDPTCVATDQRDHFNSYRQPQYPQLDLVIRSPNPATALGEAAAMIDAITDQGEGSLVDRRSGTAPDVDPRYQPSRANLEADFPSYDANGDPAPSADAAARCDNDGIDHYQRFLDIKALLPEITTWTSAGKAGHWTAADLVADDHDGSNPHGLPTPEEVAAALNAMAAADRFADSHALLSRAVVGAVAGVTMVLDQYWQKSAAPPGFPGAAMGSTGDRAASAWATLGVTPDLSLGLDPPQPDMLYHGCQALDFNRNGANSCAQVEVFHSCSGSNNCRAQGGCGFVQPAGGSAGLYSAPGDNHCRGFGGCGVPISASQLLPGDGTMELFDFVPDSSVPGGWQPVRIGTLAYHAGDKVADIAYQAFAQVMTHRGVAPPEPQAPSALRVCFPPSV